MHKVLPRINIHIYIYIFFFFIPACTYYNLSSPSFLLLPPVVTQIRGHIAGSSPPAPTPLQEGDKISKRLFYVLHGKNVLSTQMLEVSRLLIGVGTVLRLERGAWSMLK